MTRGRARRYLLTKSDESYYPQVVADAGYDVWDWSTLNAGTLFQDSAKTTPASANGDVVGCWTDGVGGVDATQATTANKPGLATGSLNGLPTLSFDGGDLLSTGNISISTFAVWVVADVNSTTSAIYEQSVNAASNNGMLLYAVPSVNSLRIFTRRGTTDSAKTDANSSIPASFALMRHESQGTHATHLLYKNSVLATLSNTTIGDVGTGTATAPLFIGARSGVAIPMTGNIGQLLIMSPYPTDASILVNMESYINGLWGVY